MRNCRLRHQARKLTVATAAAGVLLAASLTLIGCADDSSGTATKSCLDGKDETTCNGISGCAWTGCEGGEYECSISAGNATESCACAVYSQNETCAAGDENTCTKESHTVSGTPCRCRMCKSPTAANWESGFVP
eukprot:gb/GFBE01058469.1/.p1 GENE.gb/GFBE01058469.1/~~gb/GFBE01058469.1/.p1  ORF type:complete len:134 (+),score=14.34 gb/GFBE01058469.1/:1-402(+)